jgi:hypothetical protein
MTRVQTSPEHRALRKVHNVRKVRFHPRVPLPRNNSAPQAPPPQPELWTDEGKQRIVHITQDLQEAAILCKITPRMLAEIRSMIIHDDILADNTTFFAKKVAAKPYWNEEDNLDIRSQYRYSLGFMNYLRSFIAECGIDYVMYFL